MSPWTLIAVLRSTAPLTEALALHVYRCARDLFDRDGDVDGITGDEYVGSVRNLRSHVAIGDVTGPAFVANLDIGAGKAEVRFLLTKQGLRSATPAGKAN
jgi:hypothetical protein